MIDVMGVFWVFLLMWGLIKPGQRGGIFRKFGRSKKDNLYDMKLLPVLKGSWLLGGVLEFAKDPIHFVTDNLQKYNGTFIADFKFAKLLITDQPEHILHVLQKNNRNYVKSPGYTKLSWALGKGLLTNEGESWLKQRRLIQPAFHRQKLEKIFLGMVEQTDHYCTQLQQYKHSGQELDITPRNDGTNLSNCDEFFVW
jgi:cytochrome P450